MWHFLQELEQVRVLAVDRFREVVEQSACARFDIVHTLRVTDLGEFSKMERGDVEVRYLHCLFEHFDEIMEENLATWNEP